MKVDNHSLVSASDTKLLFQKFQSETKSIFFTTVGFVLLNCGHFMERLGFIRQVR